MVVDLDLARARLTLRQKQFPDGVPPGPEGTPLTDQALARFSEMTRTIVDENSGRLRRGPFSYDPETEAQRIARGEELIRRVEPGSFEDPNYFAMLAYQAASVELAHVRLPIEREYKRERFSRFLLGTAHKPEVNSYSYSERYSAYGYTIVLLHSGLVDFIYQAAKCVVAALAPRRATDRRFLVQMNPLDLDAVRANLATDQAPINRLYSTLKAYFFCGYPRATSSEVVPEEHQPPLSLLVGLAERWMIAHEYGHGLAPPIINPHEKINPKHIEEYTADDIATIATVLSATDLDAVSPEVALQSAIFMLSCFDVLERAHALLVTGSESGLGSDTSTHPPPEERAHAVIASFRRNFDMRPGEGLFFTPRRTMPEHHNFDAKYFEVTRAYANVLKMIWKPTAERLLYDRHRPLDPMWTKRAP